MAYLPESIRDERLAYITQGRGGTLPPPVLSFSVVGAGLYPRLRQGPPEVLRRMARYRSDLSVQIWAHRIAAPHLRCSSQWQFFGGGGRGVPSASGEFYRKGATLLPLALSFSVVGAGLYPRPLLPAPGKAFCLSTTIDRHVIARDAVTARGDLLAETSPQPHGRWHSPSPTSHFH